VSRLLSGDRSCAACRVIRRLVLPHRVQHVGEFARAPHSPPAAASASRSVWPTSPSGRWADADRGTRRLTPRPIGLAGTTARVRWVQRRDNALRRAEFTAFGPHTITIIRTDQIQGARLGRGFAWLGGTNGTSELKQDIFVSDSIAVRLAFFLRVRSSLGSTSRTDTLRVIVRSDEVSKTIGEFSNLDADKRYKERPRSENPYKLQRLSLAEFRGHMVTLLLRCDDKSV
jgi:hypothetical protein